MLSIEENTDAVRSTWLWQVVSFMLLYCKLLVISYFIYNFLMVVLLILTCHVYIQIKARTPLTNYNRRRGDYYASKYSSSSDGVFTLTATTFGPAPV